MSHPHDQLLDYALGELEPPQLQQLEQHLRSCSQCQEELRALNEALVYLTESLPATPAPDHAFTQLQARIAAEKPQVQLLEAKRQRHVSWRPAFWLALACVSLLLSGVATWGWRNWQNYQVMAQQQRVVASWLSRVDVINLPLLGESGERVGGLLLLPDGRALFVLRDSLPSNQAYQVWGHRGEMDRVESLHLTRERVFEVRWQGFDYLYLSLEPASGSDHPTQPLAKASL